MKTKNTQVFFLSALFILFGCICYGQKKGTIAGHVKYSDSSCAGMIITIDSALKSITDKTGYFEFREVPYGRVKLEVFSRGGTRRYKRTVNVNHERTDLQISLSDIALELDEIVINKTLHLNGLGRMDPIRGNSIFEAKKNDVLVMKNIDANLATNNTRQVFAKVAGTNVWENDGSGIQVNVSSRGLSPNRSWEYNMRQNNYDIAADILGYPDMYYSPPMDAISHIEVVRGSASLQYGTQMGGLLNFVLKPKPGEAGE